ncbi:MAG TPA: biotin-dependent carboxyltransferase family protein [Acetobacteraceae bacterium]|nr:biotin-dependent carboxyltransferase family protein [Acetobacteraceae bacterium]
MSGLRVLKPGLHTTVQDLGRVGLQAFGVSVSGALDRDALRIANALVGNAPGEAALEVLHAGPTLEVTAPALRVALAAYDGELVIESAGRRILPAWQAVTLPRGTRLRIVASRAAVCSYLAVGGGMDIPLVAGSRSTFVRGGFGGWQGRALAPGDDVPAPRLTPPTGKLHRLETPPEAGSGPLRVVLGPQDDYFTAEAIATLCGADYVVTRAADRMGLRLDGPKLAHARGHDIVSDGAASGALQVPGDGRPVLLMADRQTTGGYPKIAAVCTADLPRAGRLRPGDRVRFAVISVAEAQAARRRQEARLAALIGDVTAADESAALLPRRRLIGA